MFNNKEKGYFDMLFHFGENGYEECNVSVENKNDEVKILCSGYKFNIFAFLPTSNSILC